MLSRIRREGQKLAVNGTGVNALQSLSFGYETTAVPISTLGLEKVIYAPNSPQTASIQANSLMVYDDFFVGFTGELPFSGQVEYKNEKVKFLGKIDNMLDVYRNIDIVVLPSWREGLSKSLLEAASMSLPIITTDVPGCKDIISNNYSGILVPLRNVEKLESAIKFYLDNHQLALNYGKNARKEIIKRFSSDFINKQILNLYNDF